MLEFIVAAAAGLGLSSACGFRVFVPPLMACVASRFGLLTTGDDSWLNSNAALVVLSVAAALEFVGYLIPWFDHLLDTIATPSAAVAGLAMTATTMGEAPEWLKWSLALIVGAGSATMVQTGTVAIRGTSTATTAGFANPLIGLLEAIGAFFLSLLAIVAPILGGLLAIALLIFVVRRLQTIRRWWVARKATATAQTTE